MFTLSELVVLLAVLSATASGYFVSIDAHAEECFYERVNSGTKMGLMFEVAEGGFLDIDVEVRCFTRIAKESPNARQDVLVNHKMQCNTRPVLMLAISRYRLVKLVGCKAGVKDLTYS